MTVLEQIRERLDPLLDAIEDRWSALSEDHQALVKLTAGILAVMLPLLIIVIPLTAGRISAHNKVAEARERLNTALMLERKILENDLSEKAVKGKQKKKPVKKKSLISILDRVASKVEVSSLVQAMRPVKNAGDDTAAEAVEIQLKGLVLDEIVQFVYEIEMSSEQLQIRRLELSKESKNTDTLKANIEVAR